MVDVWYASILKIINFTEHGLWVEIEVKRVLGLSVIFKSKVRTPSLVENIESTLLGTHLFIN